MLSHVSVRPAATRRPVSWRAAATMTALGLALAAVGCAQTPPPIGATAADARAPVAPLRYRPVLGNYAGTRPTEPAPWTGVPKKEGSQ
jgi:hypothetical protein